MKSGIMVLAALLMAVAVGCSTPSTKVKQLNLGMTPQDVIDEIGEPYTIRAAKVYEDGQSMQVWEYRSSVSINPKTYWVFFENEKLVQWGQPGDFAGQSGESVPVAEYKAVKDTR